MNRKRRGEEAKSLEIERKRERKKERKKERGLPLHNSFEFLESWYPRCNSDILPFIETVVNGIEPTNFEGFVNEVILFQTVFVSILKSGNNFKFVKVYVTLLTISCAFCDIADPDIRVFMEGRYIVLISCSICVWLLFYQCILDCFGTSGLGNRHIFVQF